MGDGSIDCVDLVCNSRESLRDAAFCRHCLKECSAERAKQIAFLQVADANLSKILNLRLQIIATTDPRLIENLNTKLTSVITDAEAFITEAGGPSEGLAGPDPTDNIIQITNVAEQRADSVVAWLGLRISVEKDAAKKQQLTDARDALKKHRSDLGTLRTAFLQAVAAESGVAQALAAVTNQINAINTTITQDYDIFKAT